MPRTPMAAATPPTTKRVPTAARKATVNRRASAAPRVRQEATAGSAVAAARPGRPRDPSIDHRAVQAALQIYSDHGLAGLSFEQVSRQSSVGKAALYSRWHDVESLLIDGLRTIAPAPAVPDSGSLRQDLRQLTLMLCRLYSGSYGRVTVRILLDASLTPALRPYYEDFTAAYVRAATAIVERGVDRQELVAAVDPSLLLEQVFGATMLHALFFSNPDRPLSPRAAGNYANKLVDRVLAGFLSDDAL